MQGSAMSKRVADLLVETLQAAGVKTCYGVVGDTLNQIAHAIDRSEIDWVHVRHEEAGAFAAAAEASLTGRLTACAGSCGPGSLHFINGLYEANRNRAPVVVIATQIVRQDLGFESIQEIDFDDVFKGCSVYCEMIVTPEQARRKTVAACQAALTRRGVAVLVVSEELDELFEICDRIAVLAQGRLSPAQPRAKLTVDAVGVLMGGVGNA